MYKLLIASVALLMLTFVPLRSFSQITASPASGCAPLSVQLSGPAGATNVSWNLGSLGTTTISNPNPLYTSAGTYIVTYNAIVGGSPVSYSTQIIVGNSPSGSFSFQMPSSHCAPMTVSFTAAGGSPGSTFNWAFGDLTPLGTGSVVTHTYLFSNSFVPVAIVIDAVSGCTAVANGPAAGTVNVSNPPTVNINSSNGLIGCVPPFTTNITGTTSVSGSPIGGGLTYAWSFNSGTPNSSNIGTPGLVTFPLGTHTVMLTATDNNQCSSTGSVFISVVSPSLNAVVPPTVCLNSWLTVTVTSPQSSCTMSSTSVPVFTVFSLIPNQPNVFDSVVQMNVPGPHTVNFVVQAAGICPTFTLSKVVFVEQILPGFGASQPSVSCGPTMVVTYNNTTTINSGAPMNFTFFPSWAPNSSWQAIPANVFTSGTNTPVSFTLSQGSLNPYTLYNYFQPIITIKAKSANGCEASWVDSPHTLMRPNARFTMNKRDGCSPLVVDFRDTSWAHPDYPVTNWTWSSGANPNVVITGTQLVTFTYSPAGVYIPTLTILTAGGCTSTITDTIRVGAPPTMTATFPSSVCAGVPVQIVMSGTSTSGSSGSPDHWHFVSDEQFFSGCITNSSPAFPFTHVGTHTVGIMGYERNCGTLTALPGAIVVHGPFGKFQYTTHCTGNKKSVDFAIHLQDATSAVLNYGDNSAPLNLVGTPNGVFAATFTHIYPASGDYTVSLVSSNNAGLCGPRTFTQVVKIRQLQSRITINGQQMPAVPIATICTKSKYPAFSGLNSIDHTTECDVGYKWWLKTPTYENPPVNCNHGIFTTHVHGQTPRLVDMFALDTFRLAGNYTLSLEVKDVNGCADTSSVIFRVSQAVPVFTFAANPHCMSNGSVQIINTTPQSLVAPDVISSYTWSYGDGGIDTSSNPTYTPSHLYTIVPPPSQTFVVMAIAKNQIGCIDTTKHILQVNNPVTGFNSPSSIVCIPKGQASNTASFQALPGYATYSFSFGTPTNNPVWQSSTTFTNVLTNYFTPGVYFPTLTVIDAGGCKASDVLTITANGQPTAVIKSLTASGFCVPAKIKMQDSSMVFGTPVTAYQWNVGTMTSPPAPGDSILENIFTSSGTYTVSLTVYTGSILSCPSTVSKLVHVFNTKAKLEIDKTIFCLGDNITVKATGLNDVYSWKWFFGDLVPQPTIFNSPFANNPFTYKYETYPPGSLTGNAIITLKAVSDIFEGCVKTETIAVQVIRIDPTYKEVTETYRHCLNLLPDKFVSTTANPLQLFYTYQWDFGDGGTGSGATPSHLYTKAGVYPVKMMIKDEGYSCTAETVKSMTVLPLPKAEMTISDTLVCPRDTFFINLKGTPAFPGSLTGTFTPYSDSLIALPASNVYRLALTTTVSTEFHFSVKDTNSCESPPVKVMVNVPAPAPEIHTATTVVIGQEIPVNATATGSFSYHWMPEIRFLSDTIIPNPVSSTMADITYSVLVIDEPKQCWRIQSTYSVIVLPYSSVDVPDAFTPNGDGINDFIFPDGWGIKKLIYFRVYNRWGQLLFETTEYKKGWDGTFQGIPQNMETYVYQVETETFLEDPARKTSSGTFKLIR